jgi:hypothetical protein
VNEEADGPTGADDEHKMGRVGSLLLGLLLLTLGFLLLYLTVTLWPAIDKAKLNQRGTFTWFGRELSAVPDATMMLYVALVSALGSYIHVTVSFSSFAGNRKLASSWVWWYLLRVFVGSGLAVIFYFAIRGGFFSGSSSSADLNVYGIGALAGLVGLFSKQATDKLREIFETAFKTGKGFGDDARGDNLANPEPRLVGFEPAELAVDAPTVTLLGSGFMRESTVSVIGANGISETREVKLESPTRLVVTLNRDAENAGRLTFTVTNPEPGGGASRALTVSVRATAPV